MDNDTVSRSPDTLHPDLGRSQKDISPHDTFRLSESKYL